MREYEYAPTRDEGDEAPTRYLERPNIEAYVIQSNSYFYYLDVVFAQRSILDRQCGLIDREIVLASGCAGSLGCGQGWGHDDGARGIE